MDRMVRENLLTGTIYLISSLIEICETKAEVTIPWEEGFGSLESRFHGEGASETVAAEDTSSVRSEEEGSEGVAVVGKKKVRGS